MPRRSFVMLAALACACARTIPLTVTETGPQTWLARVDLLVDGAPMPFLFDTGAATSSLGVDPRTSRYPSLGTDASTGVSGQAEPCDVVQPKEIRLGSHRFAKPRLHRCDRNILGMDLLGTVVFQVDLTAHALRILPSLPEGVAVQPMQRLRRGHMTIPVEAGDQRVQALVDTGSDATVVASAFVEQHPGLFVMKRSTSGRDAHGHEVESNVYRCPTLRIGALQLQDVEVAGFDFGPELRSHMEGAPLILGNNVIGRAKWTFDPNAATWTVEPSRS